MVLHDKYAELSVMVVVQFSIVTGYFDDDTEYKDCILVVKQKSDQGS